MPPRQTTDDTTIPIRQGAWVLLLLASLAGLVLSILLAKVHYNVHTDAHAESFCNLGGKFNCDTVARSPQALFAGIPTSSWGLWGYSIASLVALWGWRRPRRPEPAGIALWIALGFAATSANLAYVSITQVDALCILCMGTYGANLLFLVGALLVARPWGPALGAPIRFLRQSPAPAIGLLVAVAGSAGLLVLAHPVYWKAAPTPNLVHRMDHPHGIEPGGGHYLGAKDHALVVTEFSDYECPYCQLSHHQLRELLDRYPTRLRIVHRHYPLDQACNPSMPGPLHRFACLAATIAECAGKQDKFWPANDYLFANARHLEGKTLAQIAKAIGLDLVPLQACMKEEGPHAVGLDVKQGNELNIQATPTFLIEGKVYKGQLPALVLERLSRP